ERKTMPLEIVVLFDSPSVRDMIENHDLPYFRAAYGRLGISIETIVPTFTFTGGHVKTIASDKYYALDPATAAKLKPATSTGATDAKMRLDLAKAFKGAPNTLRVFYVGRLKDSGGTDLNGDTPYLLKV